MNYGGLFEGWEIGIAKKVINDFKRNWKCLKEEDSDDLLQDCLSRWYSVKEGYDASAGASQQTYMFRIVTNEMRQIVRKLATDKRRIVSETVSIDQPLSEDEDAPTLLDKIAADSNFISNLRIHSELKIDITRVIETLTPKQQKLCRFICEEGLNFKEACRLLNVNHRTIHREIERIRAVFKKENLQEYF